MHSLYDNKIPKIFEISFTKFNKLHSYCTRLASYTKHAQPSVNKTFAEKQVSYKVENFGKPFSHKLKVS